MISHIKLLINKTVLLEMASALFYLFLSLNPYILLRAAWAFRKSLDAKKFGLCRRSSGRYGMKNANNPEVIMRNGWRWKNSGKNERTDP